MPPYRKFFLFNAGKKTQDDFTAGVGDIPVFSLHSADVLLHVTRDAVVSFIHHNVPIDFSNAYVFIRRKGDDSHFCGILNEYLAHHHISANDPIHLSYKPSAGKISQTMQLALAHIPIPDTMIFRKRSFLKNREYFEQHLSFPTVYKTDGSKGKNVFVAHTFAELEALLHIQKPDVLALVQPFIENTFDTRTIVTYGTILGTISRTRTHGYLNNIALGAQAALYELSEAERDIAIRASNACRIDVAGVDMIHTGEGPLVLEVNKSPEIGGFESVHHFKIFTKIAELIRSQRAVSPVDTNVHDDVTLP